MRKRTLTLVTRNFTLAPGHSSAIMLKLSKRNLAALRLHQASLTMTISVGKPGQITRRIVTMIPKSPAR